MYVVLLCICFLGVGVSLGMLLRDHQNEKHVIGNLRVDSSTGEPYMFLEVNNDVGGIKGVIAQKWVILKVSLEDYQHV
mgnify:CR=1 FL=1